MPRASKRKPDIDPAGTYVCWMSGAAVVDGEELSFYAGQRLRGDSPLVQATAQFWQADGDELLSAWDTVVERNDAARPPVVEHDAIVMHKPEPLERQDVRVLAKAITVLVGAGGEKEAIQYEKGTIFNARSELCAAAPDAFEDAEPGVQFTKRGRR